LKIERFSYSFSSQFCAGKSLPTWKPGTSIEFDPNQEDLITSPVGLMSFIPMCRHLATAGSLIRNYFPD
jgi:hypothetical protein